MTDEPLFVDDPIYRASPQLPSLPPSGITPGSTFAAAMLANVNLIQESIGTQSAAFTAKENEFSEKVSAANGMYETTEEENTARVQAAGQGMGDEKEHRHGAKPVDYKRDKGDDPQKPDPDKPNPKDPNPKYPRRSADGTYRGGNDGRDGKLEEQRALDKLEQRTGRRVCCTMR